MALCELFELDDLELIEGTFEELSNERFLAHMLRGSREVRLLVSHDERPLAMAREDNGWKAVSFLWKEPSDELIEALPELDLKVYTCDTRTYREAVCDHFSRRLLDEVEPAMEDVPVDRAKKVFGPHLEGMGLQARRALLRLLLRFRGGKPGLIQGGAPIVRLRR